MSANINDNNSPAQEQEDKGSQKNDSPEEKAAQNDAGARQPEETRNTSSNQGENNQHQTRKDEDTSSQQESDGRRDMKHNETVDTSPLEEHQKEDSIVKHKTGYTKNEQVKVDQTRRDNDERESPPSTTNEEPKHAAESSKRQGGASIRNHPSLPHNLRLKPSDSHNISVDFYVYVHGNKPVDKVYLLFNNGSHVLLHKIDDDRKLWHYQLFSSDDLKRERIEYRYRAVIKRDSHFPLVGKYFSKDDLNIEELGKRKIDSNLHYDVFHSPHDQRYYMESVAQSIIFYTKWLLPSLHISNISRILQQIEKMRFMYLDGKNVKDFISWIINHVIQLSINDVQRLYLCVLLAHLCDSHHFSLPNKKETKAACDRLLACFSADVNSVFKSPPSVKIWEKLAIELVKHSSCPGWLNLAATFYSYLGVDYILQKRYFFSTAYNYSAREYQNLMDLLLRNIDVDSKNYSYKRLLKALMEMAPNNDIVVKLYDRPDIDKFFASETEKKDFFVEFYQNIHHKSSTRKDVGASLIELVKIPQELLRKMYRPVHSSMLNFLRSDDEMEEQHIKAFLDLMVLDYCLQKSDVNDLLIEIAKSKLTSRHNLLLNILNMSLFEDNWRDTSMVEKVKICCTWITTKVVNEKGMNDGMDTTTAVYHGIDVVMRCSLNKSNNKLAEEVSKTLIHDILRNEPSLSILKAFVSIEKYSTVVQNCYKANVKNIFSREPRLTKKSIKVLEEFTNSSLGHELLFYVLDVIDIPTIPKSNVVDETAFRSVLEWSDVWAILFKTTGSFERYQKFRDGKLVCQQLKTCIEKGNVSIQFLQEIESNIDKVTMLCAGERFCKSTFSMEGSKAGMVARISELKQIVQDCSEKFKLLGSVMNYGRKILDDIHSIDGFQTLIKEFNERNSSWQTKKINDLQDDAFWGPLFHLIQPAKTLQPLMNSLSFMTIAKKGLEESSFDSHENKAAARIRDFYSFIRFLTNNAIEKLQVQWNPVLHDPGSLSVETMKKLLGTLKNQNKLDEELELLAKYFKRSFSPDVKIYMEDYMKYPRVLKQVRHVIGILGIFGFADSLNETSSLSDFETTLVNINKLTLTALHKTIQEVTNIVSPFSGEVIDHVIEELSRSSVLLDFIQEIVDEDIRFLIDAVEEHSDQFVSESLVSDLIDVHRFLAPLIKTKMQENCNAEDFLKMLKTSCLEHKDIAFKIHQSSTNVNSLRGLYTSIANRGEITKEIIGNCLRRGLYHVSIKEGKCEATMSYESEGKSVPSNYILPDLHDLRSRAHLIVSSHKNSFKFPSSDSKVSSVDIDFEEFINQINLLTEIFTLLSKLRSSGYVKYRDFETEMKSTEDLRNYRDGFSVDLEKWENSLAKWREKCYLLNYYSSDQLCILYDFLMNRSNVNCDEALSLIHFVNKKITKSQLEQRREKPKTLGESHSDDDPSLFLSTICQALEDIQINSEHIRWIPGNDETQSYVRLQATVTPGEIFVASLEPHSPLTANVVLTLYENTSNAFPEPHQIVFCRPDTSWEEIHLLLRRCFTLSQYLNHHSLFCIANVELLPNELQFKLVNEIKEKQNFCQSSKDTKSNVKYQLALICRGGAHHHIVEQFSECSHHIAGMSDHILSRRLKSGWPNVKMITSTLPGLGKTEHIKREVQEMDKNIVTFSISGPFEPTQLIQRLKELNLKDYNCLHLNIGEVSDPLLLDTFLFQLVVTEMVSAGMQFYHIPTIPVYIEIANTLKDRLRESLVISKFFTRIHLDWQKYKDLLVSSEITSNVQVVCQYLDIYDRGCIEKEEVHFSGPDKPKPLPARRCQELLAKHFSSSVDVTFTVLNTFLGVFADQLLKFSKSAYFKIANLKSVLGEGAKGVRANLFVALLEVSKQFASRAITTNRSYNVQKLSHEQSLKVLDKAVPFSATSSHDMVKRVEGMIQWQDDNHLLVVFHAQNSQSITAVYRNKSLVPSSVRELLNSQKVGENKELDDFKLLSQEQLQEKLEKIASTKLLVNQDNLFATYALTPDNMLKMILIVLRVRANVPVIIMGETGCGKTSLVRYLANTCGVQFFAFNFHAGISESEIISFIRKKESSARDKGGQTWIFLDEINTCDHLGLIADIMCHHSLLGRPLSKNLVFLAACNPYKLRPEEHITTAGLEGKNVTDEFSGLVYRVHPLPEAMIDYVWDYGSLSPKDEHDYIERMVSVLPNKRYEGMLVDLLATSQKLIREAEKNNFCVSLRDVHRCILLISWFEEMQEKRNKISNSMEVNSKPFTTAHHLRKYFIMSERYNKKPMIKSIVLALAHCYLSRLPTAELRENYRDHMIKLFSKSGVVMNKSNENIDSFSAIVRIEEEDYLDRMELPSGTARNAALRENVFVMLVSILNHIPVFVVGKPGCSKSLSIQLIRSNLRGRDSRDPLFRELPQLYVVSYQGSESSTSEGIIKVFEKARKYKSHNRDGNVLPVVLLDEVGLAENSKYNPLKVLHSLLEPGEGKMPDIAVVGISNWSLDAAKMNRAIHLSRPEPTVDDLYETGYSLHWADGGCDTQCLSKKELKCLAEAYVEYQAKQIHANFHGLRDYYSLIKSLTGRSSSQQVNVALQRNFGGLRGGVNDVLKLFLDKLKTLMTTNGEDIIPVTKLIEENLTDPHARHLMLITSGDSAIGILKQSLAQLERETITIYGSRFEEDLSEEYNYRILSRIILCMERDCILILRDLESIYGSLYDMLNQNYAVVGNRKNCRVALGAYSNPMCQVNDGFRCIVLVDQHKVDFSDPPFLNRFEKQLLGFSDVLTVDQKKIITDLDNWIKDISTVEALESQFYESDMFIGFHEDTLPSLVLLHGSDTDSSPDEILKRCKDDLMWIASPDGVLRTERCELLKKDSKEVQDLRDEYFKKPVHQGLAALMEHIMVTNNQDSSFFASDEIGSKTVVVTFSNIHTDIGQCLGDSVQSQVERLSAYKSEKQLALRIDEFWNHPERQLLVLQCKPELDGAHLLHARSIIEEKRNSYKRCSSENSTQSPKHVCIVVHLQRGEDTNNIPWQFSFLCGWKQVFLDVLESPRVPLNELLGNSIQKLTSDIWPIRKIVQNDLLWCFSRIKYTRCQRPLDSVLHIAKSLFSSDEVYNVIEQLILKSIDFNVFEEACGGRFGESWQVKVASDRQSLINSSTLYCAMEQFVSRLVQIPLAKIVYFLEKENAWPPHLANDKNLSKFEHIWCKHVLNEAIVRISEIPEPRGAESYVLESPRLDLCLPFSQITIRKVDSIKKLFLEEYATLVGNEDNLNESGQLMETIRMEQLKRFSEIISNLAPEIHNFTSISCNSYMEDLFDLLTADFCLELDRSRRVSVAQAVFVSEIKQNLPTNDMLEFFTLLHSFAWIHREEIFAILRMIDCCQSFIRLDVLSNVIDNTSLEEVVFVKTEQENISDAFGNKQVVGSMTHYNKKESGHYTYDEQETNKIDEKHENSLESDINHVTYYETDEASEATLTNMAADVLEFEESLQSAQVKDDDVKDDDVKDDDVKDDDVKDDDGKDDDVISDGDLNEPAEIFRDILTTVYCEEMFPTRETVEKNNGGLDQWMRNAMLLISLASKISSCSPAFFYLRLCIDFSRIILTPATLITRIPSLFTLGNIGIALKPEYLNHDESFEKITDQLITPLEQEMGDKLVAQEALHEFSALFYGRCLETNVDNPCAGLIVERVLSLKRPELVITMRLVVLRLLTAEEEYSPGIFVNIIINPSVIKTCSCLQIIDEVFKDRFSSGFMHNDSYPAVMICDTIQTLLHFEERYSIEDINSSDCELLMLTKSATTLLAECGEDSCGLTVLSSVAFLRKFFTMLALFIAKNPNALQDDSAHVVTEVNLLLNNSISSLKLFFLKQLSTHANLFDVQKWFAGNKHIPTMEPKLWCNKECSYKAVFSSVLKYPEYNEAEEAYRELVSNEAPMQNFLTECQSSPKHAYVLLGVLVNMVYLKRAVRKLSDKEEQVVNWFVGKLTPFPLLYQQLLLNVLGRRDFRCSQLQLSPESSVDDVEMALLILHIACVVTTSALNERLPMYRYFTNPLESDNPYVLAHGNELHSVFELLPSIKGLFPVTCTCGLRVALKDVVVDQICPHCNQDLRTPQQHPSNTSPTDKVQKPSKRDRNEWDACPKHMNPAAYRALRIIVYSSYYAGNAFSERLKTPNCPLSCVRYAETILNLNPGHLCFETVKSDMSHLMTILCCKKEVAIRIMHMVVDRCSNLIRRGDASTNRMCQQWETTFTKLTKPVFLNARASSKELKQMKKLQYGEVDSNHFTIEDRILELDDYPSESEEQNQRLKRLYRLTKQPSFEDFRSAFLHAPKALQRKHGFLAFFFATYEKLPMIGHLYHLLQWCRLVTSALTHRISRKEAQSKSIADFISGQLLEIHRSQQEIGILKESFTGFKKAWNEMRQLVNEELLGEKVDEMPRLREYDCVAYCLTESDYGIYLLTAIRILVSSQNFILDEINSLSSSHKYPALSFLERYNGSCIMATPIQDVKENEIISFQWSDDFFMYAHNSPVYGEGESVKYDFERMEISISTKVALGKRFLTGTLNKFIFAKELFHSCGPILDEIRSLVTQSSSLPDEVRNGLSYLKEQTIKAQVLLQHMEVLIFVLKPKLAELDVDLTLEELVEKRLPMLPSPFPVILLPQPRSSIKIKHIAALYEALEDMLADGAIEGLAKRFSMTLPTDIKQKLNTILDEKTGQMKPPNFLRALRRFVFRYLSSETERYWPGETTALQSWLKEPSLWSPFQQPNLDIIPKEITLEYVYSIVKYLEEIEMKRKGDNRRLQVGKPPGQTKIVSQHGRTRNTKAKRQRNLGKSLA
ncbi:LOW QUALITY PROTEIN: uncharacterized protein LOC114521280 [Dendronephthya gigantea]|uniref:LOW QUALITY PROTEIN: uncharacterized protein LOC114521280 n=1 Tax=Dendronephthya gigantea TaxID=151771 RepID=UPI001068DE1A|nr:LOW QUALITY PROTEIN: uncharacterized protein LOC114521280 [Dendronephthya gigantea]